MKFLFGYIVLSIAVSCAFAAETVDLIPRVTTASDYEVEYAILTSKEICTLFGLNMPGEAYPHYTIFQVAPKEKSDESHTIEIRAFIQYPGAGVGFPRSCTLNSPKILFTRLGQALNNIDRMKQSTILFNIVKTTSPSSVRDFVYKQNPELTFMLEVWKADFEAHGVEWNLLNPIPSELSYDYVLLRGEECSKKLGFKNVHGKDNVYMVGMVRENFKIRSPGRPYIALKIECKTQSVALGADDLHVGLVFPDGIPFLIYLGDYGGDLSVLEFEFTPTIFVRGG